MKHRKTVRFANVLETIWEFPTYESEEEMDILSNEETGGKEKEIEEDDIEEEEVIEMENRWRRRRIRSRTWDRSVWQDPISGSTKGTYK